MEYLSMIEVADLFTLLREFNSEASRVLAHLRDIEQACLNAST